MKKKLCILTAALMMGAAAAYAQSWNCGNASNEGGAASVQATLSGGTLTISGTGAMAGYGYSCNAQSVCRTSAPWKDYEITAVVVEAGVTTIGYNAFSYYSGLTSVTLSNTVTTINDAFSYCSGLASITIPNSVKSISNFTFQNCSELTSVTIGNGVTTIGSYAFNGCSKLTDINVDNANTRYSSENGVLFNNAKDTLVTYPVGKQGAYTLPNGVTTIGSNAFLSCSGLTSVTLPASVTTISSDAFNSCTGLTSVILPDAVTSIGDNAFRNCSGLTDINVGGANTRYSSVNGVLFNSAKDTLIMYPAGKQGAYTLPDGVTTISNYAFLNCKGLTSVTLPASVTTIGNYAFGSCNELTSVTIPNSVTTIGGSAFAGCSGLTSVTIPNSVTSIGNSAFYGCSGLTSITIPASVTTIGNNAFQNCIGLTSINIPDGVTIIGGYTFASCSVLKNVTIGNGVDTIGNYAFSGCTGLRSLYVNRSTPARLGNNVFYNISNKSACTLYVPMGATANYQAITQWQGFTYVEVYAVTFNSQGGSTVAPQPVVSGDTAPQPADPTRTGYDFGGWYQESACTTAWDFATVVTSDTTLYAKWTAVSYSITYTLNSGTGANDSTYTVESAAVTLPTPSRANYTFAGWYDNAGFTGSAVTTIATGSAGDKVFYAKWTAVSYSITYTLNGGTGATNSTYTVESAAVTLPTPARPGYEFAGWYDNAGFTGSAVTTIATGSTGDTAFYAKWTATSATAVAAQSAQKLQVYPTIVTNGQLTIDNGQLSAGGKVEVYSLVGSLAGVYNVSGGASTTINIAHLPAGIYIVKVGNKAAKVVKQ
ncbi:hypothetical protein FACS189452_04060 [Bacteroidia bacterium]|nr:hypothetical protein FACS189452_04060 [Bacteroidia bacterium]